ncbi:MAG: 3-hydroxyacyl-CoA dehydrogenase/enoyl-CoA hydratase family protein [Burkholderiaceae bacterium]|nr:3-hydroxyacyl-CoA dehydrogenase/enoyl-CoA hydratase family protein [Burkholderiaceae bacterium]
MATPQSAAVRPAHSVRRLAVLGAGVMGAQIAAHAANAGLPVVLFDLPSPSGDKSAIARQAIVRLAKMNPAPLGSPAVARRIQPANYDEHLDLLGECDLVIEAIAERLDLKRDLYARIAPAMAADAWLASNTSGLSIESLSEVLPEGMHARFCGVHFFNPPRYMSLVELIPTSRTAAAGLDALETFLVEGLGKNVVRARDTPNFIGNRIGVFGILSTMIEAERYGLTYELVDELTGKRLGRAKSGTFRTADVVGLDTLAHVIGTMQKGLPDDPFSAHFATPPVLAALVEQGALGQKAGAGFYKKSGKSILRLDPAKRDYVPAEGKVDPEVAALLAQRDPVARMKGLRESGHPQAQFVWAVLRDTFHYAAVHLADIADTARDVDYAMRWGFGQGTGPFETWQAAGWLAVAEWIEDDRQAGRCLSDMPLPEWVTRGPVADAGGPHQAQGSYNPVSGQFEPRRDLPVYRNHLSGVRLAGEAPRLTGQTVHENDHLRLWTLPAPHPQTVLVASFKTKMHTISLDVTEGLIDAVQRAEADYEALVIWQDGEPFSAGADLQSMLPAVQKDGPAAIEPIERRLQDAALSLRYARVPTVAALRGLALGGGCELAVHATARVAAFETYIGLVEVGVGLVPGAGGLAYCARRAAEQRALAAPDMPLLAFLRKFAEAVAGAKVSPSALEALAMGYLRETDPVVMHPDALLAASVHHALGLARSGYRPPPAEPFKVAGRDGAATLKVQLVNMRDGGFISEHDFLLGCTVAHVLCGGDVDPDTEVDDAWMLGLEREAFISLLGHPKTQERIGGLLKTGKPVRN